MLFTMEVSEEIQKVKEEIERVQKKIRRQGEYLTVKLNNLFRWREDHEGKMTAEQAAEVWRNKCKFRKLRQDSEDEDFQLLIDKLAELEKRKLELEELGESSNNNEAS